MANEENKKQKSKLREVIDFLLPILIAVAVALVLKYCIIANAVVPTGSMLNTIQEGDRVIASRLAYVKDDPQRYDIVIFKYPDDEKQYYVKRIVGLPGETLSFKNGYTYVNGEKLDESYLPTQGITYPRHEGDTFTVPEGCIFFMGDNRGGSNDSRLLGEPYVPVSNIQGRMLVAISVGSDQSWQGIRLVGQGGRS